MARSALCTFLFLLCCHTSDAKPANPKSAAPARVTLLNAAGDSTEVEVELAVTPHAREIGLMNRAGLTPNRGMIFVFPRASPQQFWMKNTLIALDMIFIRADLTIAGIVAEAEPLTLTGRGVNEPSLYVLEVVGGYAAAHHLATGDRVKLENVPAVTE